MHLKKLGLASALALVVSCGLAGTASATAIDPASTAVTMSSTNSSLSVSGGGTVSCTSSTFSGTTPAAGDPTTWLFFFLFMALSHSGCTAFGFINTTVTASSACVKLHAMGVNAATAIGVVTLPSGCSIDVNVPSIGCTLTIAGPQTIGNGTAGAGGIQWTNTNPAIAHVNAATVPSVVSNGVGFGCATAGAHTGSLSGTYTRTSATNATVTP